MRNVACDHVDTEILQVLKNAFIKDKVGLRIGFPFLVVLPVSIVTFVEKQFLLTTSCSQKGLARAALDGIDYLEKRKTFWQQTVENT